MTRDPARLTINSEPPSQVSNSSQHSRLSRLSRLAMGLRSVFRNEISAPKAALELLRRGRVKLNQRHERAQLARLARQTVQLLPEFQELSPAALLNHFRERSTPSFFYGFEFADSSTVVLQRKLFPRESEQLIESALLISKAHRWPLMGFGEKDFGEQIDWHKDPLSGRIWPLNFHADITLWHNDGSDVRVLWELNRLGHLLLLGRAYALTENEQFSEEFFLQIDSWRQQNPVGLGANWRSAMEVALRAMNVMAALMLFRRSPALTESRLPMLLSLLEQHGAHICRNLEFSHVATSNHYLSDIVGLLWLGIMLPELRVAKEWRKWAFGQMLHEMDKQVTADGADYESSTGYHRFVLELFLYSFILCQANHITIHERYWKKLESMLHYLQAYLRPNGFAPLIGDTDSGQALPIVRRAADDHDYLLALGSIAFRNSNLKPIRKQGHEEALWIFGEQAISRCETLPVSKHDGESVAFPQAGTYVLKKEDLFLLFNASGAGGNGRASHGHNDSLSIEVFACNRPFIVDPGSFVYTADLHERHLFRSTAYHSTIQVDSAEQNATTERVPFVIGDEGHPRVLAWESSSDHDLVVAEHQGYKRLSAPVTHRRRVIFDKTGRCWLVEDELLGSGEHTVAVRFHFDAGLEVSTNRKSIAIACDRISGARLFIVNFDIRTEPKLESQFVSRDYGLKQPSVTACWSTKISRPSKFRWALLPVCAKENEQQRLEVVKRLIPEIRF